MNYDYTAKPVDPATPKVKPDLSKEAMKTLDLIGKRSKYESNPNLIESLALIFFAQEVESNDLVDLDTLLTLRSKARRYEEQTQEYPENDELREARGKAMKVASRSSKESGYYKKVRTYYEIPEIPCYVGDWSYAVFHYASTMANQDFEIANILQLPAQHRIGEITLQDDDIDEITKNYIEKKNSKMFENFEELAQKKAEESDDWTYEELKGGSRKVVGYLNEIVRDSLTAMIMGL